MKSGAKPLDLKIFYDGIFIFISFESIFIIIATIMNGISKTASTTKETTISINLLKNLIYNKYLLYLFVYKKSVRDKAHTV